MLDDEATAGLAGSEADAGSRLPSENDFAEIRSRLRTCVRRVCPAWLRDHVEDIVQAGMVRLLEAGRKSGENGALATIHLRTVAYYAAMDEIRRHVRRREVPEEEGHAMEVTKSPAADPEREAAAREIERGIGDCMARLVRPRRLAVTLHLLGYSFPEVGRSLGWSTKKAEHLIYRGLDDMRRCLTTKGLTP